MDTFYGIKNSRRHHKILRTMDMDDDLAFHVSGDGESVQLKDLTRTFADAVKDAQRRGLFTRMYAVKEGDTQVAEVLLQVDKSSRKYLTIQKIGVEHHYQRQGIGREIIRSLKGACVLTSRVAHVQATLGDDIRALLCASFFKPVDRSYDYTWSPPRTLKPLTWDEWMMDVSWVSIVKKSEIASFDAPVKQMTQLQESWVRGAGAFSRNAMWFKPETDLKVISQRLGLSLDDVKPYRIDKNCYGSSSAFAKIHTRCFVLNGWAVTADIPIPLQHACLCAILDDGEVFVFDLVRVEPLYLYGVALRRAFEQATTAIDTFCERGTAEFVIDALNFLQGKAVDGEELHEVLRRLCREVK